MNPKVSPLWYAVDTDHISRMGKQVLLRAKDIKVPVGCPTVSKRLNDKPENKLFHLIQKRLQLPLAGFTSCLDLAPPPQATLHWKTKPTPGEYAKVRSLVCNGAMHAWLVTHALKNDPGTASTIWRTFWDLTECWIVDASVPRLGSSGEVTHFKEIVGGLTNVLTDALDPISEVSLRSMIFSSSLSDASQSLPRPDLLIDGVTLEDRLGILQYMLWKAAFDTEESTVSMSSPFLSDAVAFCFQQNRWMASVSEEVVMQGDWDWARRL